MHNSVPTKIKKKPASIKLDILKIFLFAFNKFIPRNVSQKPKHIKIKGKNWLGSDLFTIMLNENKGNSTAKAKLII